MENYMFFSLRDSLVFIDSMKFMSTSLDNLVSNLDRELFKYTTQVFQGEEFDLKTRKGAYPYDYMKCFEQSKEDRQPYHRPPKRASLAY